MRQVTPQHPSWGLSPEGLAAILRDSEGTDPSRYYALCEDVAEREWHYRGVLGQRRSALAQLPITVDPASDSADDVERADFIREIVSKPEFTLMRFDLSDALDKGMAFGEILWDTSESQWIPKGIELRNAHPAFNGQFEIHGGSDEELRLAWTHGEHQAELWIDFKDPARHGLRFSGASGEETSLRLG